MIFEPQSATRRTSAIILLIATALLLASCSKSRSSPPPVITPPPVTTVGVDVAAIADPFVSDSQVAKGASVRFQATARLSDGSTNDVTATVTWSSSDAAILAFESSDAPNLATAKTEGTATITAAATGSPSGELSFTVAAPVPASLAVNPARIPEVAVGEKGRFTAVYTLTDKSTVDATNDVNWSSSNGAAVIISNSAGSKGEAVANAIGTSNIGAAQGSLKSNDVAVKVFQPTQPPVFAVVPESPQALPLGRWQQFHAVKYYAADDRVVDVTADVAWSTSDASLASFPIDKDIPAGTMLANPTTTGTVTVTATDPKSSATTTPVTISITNPTIQSYIVSPQGTASDPLAVGQRRQLGVVATFSDNIARDITQTLDWAAGGLGHLSVTNGTGRKGLVTANQETPSGTPNDTIVITDPVTSASVSHEIQTVGNVLQRLDIAPTGSVDLPLGSTLQFRATGHFSDGSKNPVTEVTWESSANENVTISNDLNERGKATAVKLGSSAVINAAVQVGGNIVRSNNTVVNVTNPTLDTIEIRPTTAVDIAIGRSVRLSAWGNYSDGVARDISGVVTWASGDTSVATVGTTGNERGVVNGKAIGSASIRAVEPGMNIAATKAVSVSGKAFDGISITPAGPVSSAVGVVYKEFQASANWSDGSSDLITSDVQWKSSNNDNATVSNEQDKWGFVYPRVAGSSVTITAEKDGVVSAPVTFNVAAASLQSIAISPSAVQNPTVDEKIQFSATGTYTDGSSQTITTDVTWQSDDRNVAFITNNPPEGQMVAVGPGVANISASKDGVTSPATQVVTQGTVTVRSVTEISGGCCDGEKATLDGRIVEVISDTSFRFEDATGSIPVDWNGPNPLPLNIDIRINGVRNAETGRFAVSSYTPL